MLCFRPHASFAFVIASLLLATSAAKAEDAARIGHGPSGAAVLATAISDLYGIETQRAPRVYSRHWEQELQKIEVEFRAAQRLLDAQGPVLTTGSIR